MTAVELLGLLEAQGGDDDDREVIVVMDDVPQKITGIDSYEDALVLVTEPR